MAPPQTLPTRKLGRNGPEVASIGFGLMGLSIGYGSAPSDKERLGLLDRAWELGCTNWDTADGYGDNEDLLGKWFALHPERRGDIFLATKFGLRFEQDLAPSEDNPWGLAVDSSPENCRRQCDASLKRMGVDYVDLYYIHRLDDVTPVEHTIETMVQLKAEGKIRHLGISECSSTALRRANKVHPISAVQVEYNPWDVDIETATGTYLLDTCRELGVSVFAFSPLGRGILTGRYRSTADFTEEGDMRRNMARYQGENFARNLALVDKMRDLAVTKGCTPAQLTLAWLSAQDELVIPIPGTRNAKYLEENVTATQVSLTEEEEKAIRKLVAEADVQDYGQPKFRASVESAEL